MYSVPMAAADFIPVLLFGAAGLILMRDLYYRMSKGAYAMLCAGLMNVFTAGFLKAMYKLLYALEICDFTALSNLFFPLQAIGFLLAGVAFVCSVSNKRNDNVLYAAAPAVFSGTPIFVSFMILGLLGINVSLSIIAARMKKKSCIVFFIISFLFSLMMGYLATRDFTQSLFNWLAEGINIFGQGSLLVGVILLDKAGLSGRNIQNNKYCED